ncbi:hypothetical protein LCGC14_1602540 [marine sediment metagenome]|uniref:Uncharacterized protein n=2 Tax=root TaxID=1 RepID=A0A831QNH0_9FLAO|nr:hypothetical protein [Pricia sp.]HEA21830.1 hypothetical protein [Pricia antarctica]
MAKPNDYEDFKGTLQNGAPSNEWPDALKALWYDAKGDWKASHDVAQDMENAMGSWIHAYLHRKEGDEFNAGYWYRRAQRKFPTNSLEEEHRDIINFILDAN